MIYHLMNRYTRVRTCCTISRNSGPRHPDISLGRIWHCHHYVALFRSAANIIKGTYLSANGTCTAVRCACLSGILCSVCEHMCVLQSMKKPQRT